jgi:serine protease AprX
LNRLFLSILLIFLVVFNVEAQVNSYFVSFSDKNNTPYTITKPAEYLSQKSIDRRNKQGIPVLENDLPVDPIYIETVDNIGSVAVEYSSKWFNGAIVEANPVDIEAVKLLPFVTDVEFIAPAVTGGRIDNKLLVDLSSSYESDTTDQFQLLEIDRMRAEGYEGTGITIGVIDGGFRDVESAVGFEHLMTENKIQMAYDFRSKSDNVYQYSTHGTSVLSLLAARRNNPDYAGIVPNAHYQLFVTEHIGFEYRIEEYWWLIAAEKADSAGVDIITTSIGYNTFQDPSMNYSIDQLDGKTAVITRAAQLTADKGILFVTSAGNTGDTDPWQKVTFPGDVVDGLAVGSLITDEVVSIFSPYGPTSDGRIKPDVLAKGSGVYVLGSNGSLGTKSGTSFSAPQIAGLAAGIWQAYPEVTMAGLLQAIRESASYAFNPDNRMGYGVPTYSSIKNYLEFADSDPWISVYPNPVEDQYLNISIANPSENAIVDFNIYNTMGQPIKSGQGSVTWQENRYILDVSTLPAGIYVLNLHSDTQVSQIRFSKL